MRPKLLFDPFLKRKQVIANDAPCLQPAEPLALRDEPVQCANGNAEILCRLSACQQSRVHRAYLPRSRGVESVLLPKNLRCGCGRFVLRLLPPIGVTDDPDHFCRRPPFYRDRSTALTPRSFDRLDINALAVAVLDFHDVHSVHHVRRVRKWNPKFFMI